MRVITHEDPHWNAVYQSHGRENGAATYSREIVQFQVPVWEQETSGQVTVSTCPLLYAEKVGPAGGIPRPRLGRGDLLVQYLHEWRYTAPERAAQGLAKAAKGHYGRVVFVVAYRGLQALLQEARLTALYVPMSIDTELLAPYRLPAEAKNTTAIAYYGNVSRLKAAHYAELRRTAPSVNRPLHKINARQPESWERLARYSYGAGVGRCALEMAGLGLRVLVSGSRFGGLVMSPEHLQIQRDVNFNGRAITGAGTLRDGLQLLPSSQLWSPLDSREAAEILRGEIRGHRLSVSAG